MIWFLFLLHSLTVKQSRGEDFTILPSLSDSVIVAADHNKNLEDSDFKRYVFSPESSLEDLALISFVANSTISKTSINFTPGKEPIEILWGGRLICLHLDLLCPKDEDLENALKSWETIFNPYYLLEAEKKEKLEIIRQVLEVKGEFCNIQKSGGIEISRKLSKGTKIEIEEILDFQGNKWAKISEGFILINDDIKILDVKEIIEEANINFKVREFQRHIDPLAAASLKVSTNSVNPIVTVNTFVTEIMRQADGGKYYDFMGFRKANEAEKKQGKKDIDIWLESLGLSFEEFENTDAEQRILVMESGVTKKSRRIDFLNYPTKRSINQGLIAITRDLFDFNRKIGSDPFKNLLSFQGDGSEIIYELRNGHLAFILFNGQGGLVDEVPANIATDEEIPLNYPKRLQPAIGCIRCHGKNKEDGWRSFESDLAKSLDLFLNIYDDKEAIKKGLDRKQTIDLLQSLFKGDMTKAIERARADLSDAIVRSSFPANNNGLPLQFGDISRIISEKWNYQFYSMVDPNKALLEIGIKLEKEEKASGLIFRLLEPVANQDSPVIVDDVYLIMLRQGKEIPRLKWEEIFPDVMQRAKFNIQKIGEK